MDDKFAHFQNIKQNVTFSVARYQVKGMDMRIFACAAALVLFCQGAQAIDDTPAQFTWRDGEAWSGPQLRRDAAPGKVAAKRRQAEAGAARRLQMQAGGRGADGRDMPAQPGPRQSPREGMCVVEGMDGNCRVE